MSATRPWVDAFADEMEAKLSENRHKGDREGWQRMDADWLLARLREEVDELELALEEPREWPCAQIREEAADVANFAMMIADVAGGMKPRAEQEGT